MLMIVSLVAIARAYKLPVEGWWVIIGLIMLICFGWLYLWAVYRALLQRQKTRLLQKPKVKPHNQWVSDEAFDRMLHLFTGTEREVVLVTRMHWIRWALPAFTLGPLALVVFGTGLDFLANQRGSRWTINHKTYHHPAFPLTVFLVSVLVALVLLALIVKVVVEWYSEFFVLTEHQMLLVTLPPIWFIWMDEGSEEIPSHGFIHYLKVDQHLLGRIFGFGAFTADTPSQEDDKFHGIAPLPRVNEVRQIFNQIRDRLASDTSRSYGP